MVPEDSVGVLAEAVAAGLAAAVRQEDGSKLIQNLLFLLFELC